jgi:indole-3-glycerol phosphate synthase
LCNRLRIAALVEVHTDGELDRAVAAGARIIGVNNRNLKTLEISLETSFQLRAKMPGGCVTVSESGIKTAADLRRIEDAGFDAVLIGERFMTQPDPGAALSELLAEFARHPAPVELRNSEVETR